MSREGDFKTRMAGDAPLAAILTGGVFTYEGLGREGLTRSNSSTAGAFDADGFLEPCAVVKAATEDPDGGLRDPATQMVSLIEMVQVFLYEDQNYASIDAAIARVYTLFQEYRFSDSLPARWTHTIPRFVEEGALEGARAARMDFVVRRVKEG